MFFSFKRTSKQCDKFIVKNYSIKSENGVEYLSEYAIAFFIDCEAGSFPAFALYYKTLTQEALKK
jgi:hypothetical protein